MNALKSTKQKDLGKAGILKNKEELRHIMHDLKEIEDTEERYVNRDKLTEILIRKEAYNQSVEEATEHHFTKLQNMGKRFVGGKRLPEDMVAERREDAGNVEVCLANKVYALNHNDSEDSRVLGISYDPTTGFYTSYMSDVLRYVSPDHPHGRNLGHLIGRGVTSKGVEGTVPMFPESFHADLVPFGAKRNDGSVITISYKFIPCSGGSSDSYPSIEVGNVRFQRIRQPHLLSIQELSFLISCGNSGKRKRMAPLSNICDYQESFGEAERTHFSRIYNDFSNCKRTRESCIGQEQLRRYEEGTMGSASVRIRRSGENTNGKREAFLEVTKLKGPSPENGLAVGFFKEIRIITNHAIAVFCERHGLPIIFRGPRRCIEGDDRDRGDRNFRKWYTSPVRNAEAGIHTYAPSTNALNCALDFINQYLLHEHVKLILPPSIGQRKGAVYYDTDLTLLDYSSFETSIYSDGIVLFMEDMFEVLDTVHILNEEIRLKILELY